MLPGLSLAEKRFDKSGNVIKSSWGSNQHKSQKTRQSAVQGMKSDNSGSDIDAIKALKKKKKKDKQKCKDGSVYSAAGSSAMPSDKCPDK